MRLSPEKMNRFAELSLWRRLHHLPRFFIEWWQLRELKAAVREAYRYIPFYKNLLDGRGVRPESVKALSDVAKLPVISKQLLRQHSAEDILSNRFRPHSEVYDWKQTSGSSGEPFKFADNARFNFLLKFGIHYPASRAFSYRFLARRNCKVAKLRFNPVRESEDMFIAIPDLRVSPFGVVERLQEFKPDVVETLPTVLVELGRFVGQAFPGSPLRFSYAVTHGEALSANQRSYLENTFSCRVFNRYGLEEVGDIAMECGEQNGLHVYDDSFHVEIVNGQNEPIRPGSAGRVVITSFYNTAMPFIRYDTGDLGRIIPGSCSCGVSYPRLFINGRRGGHLILGQRKVNHLEFQMVLSKFDKSILRYQLAKVDGGKIELRIIPRGHFSLADQERVKERFQELFDVAPRIKIVRQIPYNKRGKAAVVVDETMAD